MNKMTTRRRFFQQLSLGGSALALAPAWLSAAPYSFYSDHTSFPLGMMPVAVVEDCFDLAFTLPGLSNQSKIALAGDIDLKIPGNKGRIALAINPSEESVLAVLEKIKAASVNEKSAADKYSFLLGILANHTLSQHWQPIYQQYPDHWEELSMYQDTYFLRSFAGNQATQVKEEDLNRLLNVLLPRTITRVHTLIPDSEQGPEWIIKMSQWRKANLERTKKYARIYTQPDPAKEKKYVIDTNFYRADDRIIQCCRKTQQGERVTESELNQALNTANQGSLYAQVLAQGVQRIQWVDKFLRDATDGHQLLSELKL